MLYILLHKCLIIIFFLGKPEKKAEEARFVGSRKPLVSNGASAKQVKIVDPKKDEEHESGDESDEEDEFGSSDEEVF